MKLLFLAFSGAVVYVIRCKEPFRSSYDKTQDAFLHFKFAVLPCALLAIIFNEHFELMEVYDLIKIECIVLTKNHIDFLDIFYLLGSCCDRPSAYSASKAWGSRESYKQLCRSSGNLSIMLCTELDLSGVDGKVLPHDMAHVYCRNGANSSLCGFLLLLRH